MVTIDCNTSYTNYQIAPVGELQPVRDPQIDFNSYPWRGLFEVLCGSYALNLPYLRRLTLDQIEHMARREANG